jgi:hypothetical protein
LPKSAVDSVRLKSTIMMEARRNKRIHGVSFGDDVNLTHLMDVDDVLMLKKLILIGRLNHLGYSTTNLFQGHRYGNQHREVNNTQRST